MDEQKTIKLMVYGKVQGVFYRKSTLGKAQQLGLNGWVENKADGTVHVVAQGSAEAIQSLIDWCHNGPSQAVVEKVEQKAFAPIETDHFKIER
jgi:acylphosphatase